MAFVPEAALIALREGLEALLITGILLGLVVKLGRPDARKHVWLGFAAAVAASLALGVLVQRFLVEAFEERGGAQWFELGAALAAVVVLTYMVFWMWGHTRKLMADVRRRVAALLTRGALAGIVFLTFASGLREGVEVVLFYGALLSRASPIDLAWSGLVGFAASALLVLAILRGAGRLDLARFFAVTGMLLVLVAAGLLVHSVSAAMSLGLLPPAPAIWDTGGILPDDGAAGRILHALVGYTSAPTLLQALAYFGYVFGFGGWYLHALGLFHRRTATGRAVHATRLTAAGTVVLLVAYAVTAGAMHPGALVTGHDHGPGEDHGETLAAASIPPGQVVGVLLRSHGEPVHYNETTYRSFAEFTRSLLVLLDLEELLLVDQGTVLLDRAHPFEKGPRLDARLVDAWLRPHAGPAAYVGSPFPEIEATRVPLLDGYYVAPAGPGLGEPDVLEWAGLSAYLSWTQMENRSPMHHDKLRVLEAAERILRERHGDALVVRQTYHVRPFVGAGETDAEAAEAFVAAGARLVVDAYTSSVFSDVMNTCMMRPHMEHAFHEAGYTGRFAYAAPAGPTHAYAHAVAAHLRDELARVPEGVPVAVFLTHHGQRPDAKSPCGDGPDQYNAHAARMFEAALAAIGEEITRPGVRVYQVYGQGAGAPDDGILSPLEAIEAARADGVQVVLDLPYELTGNGFDNLVAQRASYGLEPEDAPHYDARYETRLTVRGLDVRILSAAWGAQARGAALAWVVEAALAQALGAGGAR